MLLSCLAVTEPIAVGMIFVAADARHVGRLLVELVLDSAYSTLIFARAAAIVADGPDFRHSCLVR